MQYLLLDNNDTLRSVSNVVGSQNVDALLVENGLKRSPDIAGQWKQKCNLASDPTLPDVTPARKLTVLNRLTGSKDVFEKACLLDDSEWKVLSAYQSFPDTLKVPEAVKLPSSSRIIGDTVDRVTGAITSSSEPVDTLTYKAVMNGLKGTGAINPAIFNSVNTAPSISLSSKRRNTGSNIQLPWNLPWGKIQIYSSLLDKTMDIPVYPEELETARSASYTSMPDTIYQFEPWIVYENSGPREQSLSFHLHRDMWSGNHLDGKANELIRFCEANTFARYSGSTVLAPVVRVYINGARFICGVLKNTQTSWSGPIGQDGFYLEFTLSLTIQEVSDMILNIDSVSKMGLIGV